MKKIAILGGSGFIGTHLARRLRAEGHRVTVYDRKYPEFDLKPAHEYNIFDLRYHAWTYSFIDGKFDEVYQLAAEMGGAGYIFGMQNDADIMTSSAQINLNLIDSVKICEKKPRIFFSSSACVYPSLPEVAPRDADDHPLIKTACAEEDAGAPDSCYGWEKLFSEKLYDAARRNYGFAVRIGRFHNIFGPYGSWTGGREKAPAALCRKVAQAPDGGEIEVWGSGAQRRSFLYVDECVEGMIRLMRSDCSLPINIGSSEMVTIAELVQMIAQIAGKTIHIKPVPGPIGVQGRNSDNSEIVRQLRWQPYMRLAEGLKPTYEWIKEQVDKAAVPA